MDLKQFDPKCLELAEYFAQGHPGVTADGVRELAAYIQESIEDFLEAIEQ